MEGEGGEQEGRGRPVAHVDVDPGSLVGAEGGSGEGRLELNAGAEAGHVH